MSTMARCEINPLYSPIGADRLAVCRPWLALPFSDRDRKGQLSSQFGVSGIPTLVLMDKDGNVITDNGTSAVLSQPDGGFIPAAPSGGGGGGGVAELIIYGRDGCGMCSNFKSQLQSEGIDYRMVFPTP